jgi:hypothetical protein
MRTGKNTGKALEMALRRRNFVAIPHKNSITYAKNSLPKRNREFVGVKQKENRETKGANREFAFDTPRDTKCIVPDGFVS